MVFESVDFRRLMAWFWGFCIWLNWGLVIWEVNRVFA